jgi:hypothetical protein
MALDMARRFCSLSFAVLHWAVYTDTRHGRGVMLACGAYFVCRPRAFCVFIQFILYFCHYFLPLLQLGEAYI